MIKLSLSLSEVQSQIKPLGRTRFTEDGQELSWSASGIELCCKAHRIALHFKDYNSEAKAFLGVYVNNSKQIHAISGQSPMIVVAEDEGISTLRILRISAGDMPVYLQTIELYGNEEAPCLLPPPAEKARKILFIGDSITCGYGTDSERGDTVYRPWEEDATHAYAYLTAKHFDADYQIVCISGMGILKSCRGQLERQFPDFFSLANRSGSQEPDQSGFAPQLVVVNGGTNDSATVPPEEFAAGADQFLTTLRNQYPHAEIVWIYGAMGDKYSQVMYPLLEKRRETDPHMSFCLATAIYETSAFVGVNGHPTYLGQQRQARELIQHISAIMDKEGW